jgi:hypothetical protein
VPIPCGERLARVTPSAQAGCSLAAGEACRKKTRQVARAVHSPVWWWFVHNDDHRSHHQDSLVALPAQRVRRERFGNVLPRSRG